MRTSSVLTGLLVSAVTAAAGVGPGAAPAAAALPRTAGTAHAQQPGCLGSAPARPRPAPGRTGFTSLAVPRRLVILGPVDLEAVSLMTVSPQTVFEVALGRPSDTHNPGYAVWGVHPAVSRTTTGVQVVTSLFDGWGHYQWSVTAGTAARGFTVHRPVEVRQGSFLHVAVTRTAGRVTFTAAVSYYDAAAGRVTGWEGRPAAIQRWTTHGWATIRRVRTGADGTLTAVLPIRWRVGLRLTVPGTAAVWAPATYSLTV